MEEPTCADFEEYEEVPETVPINFSNDNVMWDTFKLSGSAGALREEATEIKNWIIRFGCALEEFRVVVF